MVLFSEREVVGTRFMRRTARGQAALLSLILLSSAFAVRAQDETPEANVITDAPADAMMQSGSATDNSSDVALSNRDFLNATTGGKIPTQILLKNLTKEWRRIGIKSDDNLSSMYGMGMQGQFFQDALRDAGMGVYYTKGQSVVLGKETYLIAYRFQMNMTSAEVRDLMNSMWGGHGAQPNPVGQRKFAGTTPLLLSLLNLRTAGSLEDVKPFDAARDILGPRDIIDASDNNLRQIGTFLARLSQQRYGSMGSQIRNLETLRQILTSYFHAPATIFRNPATQQDYGINLEPFNKKSALISNAKQLVALYEERPGTDGKRGALFMDGHVERVPERLWKGVLARKIETPSAQKIDAMSGDNLRQLSRYLTLFNTRVQRLPDMSNASAMQNEMNNYVQTWNSPIFRHPTNGQAYVPNKALSRLKLTNIVNRASLVAFSENGNSADGKRSVVFLSGRVERIEAARWNRLMKTRVQLKTAKS